MKARSRKCYVSASESTVGVNSDGAWTDADDVLGGRGWPQPQLFRPCLGDDCVSIGTGTSNVNISDITCGPGHGISIGSLGENNSKATVSDVTVSHSWFKKTQNGACIKTWQGGSGYVKNIVFQHLTMDAVDRPIVIDQNYCNGMKNCGTKGSAVQISGVKFIDIHGSSTRDEPINLSCSKTVPCTDITIDNVQISANGKKAISYCLNAHGTARDVSPSVSCLN